MILTMNQTWNQTRNLKKLTKAKKKKKKTRNQSNNQSENRLKLVKMFLREEVFFFEIFRLMLLMMTFKLYVKLTEQSRKSDLSKMTLELQKESLLSNLKQNRKQTSVF